MYIYIYILGMENGYLVAPANSGEFRKVDCILNGASLFILTRAIH